MIAALDGLAARGVDSCRPDDLAAMRQAAFDTLPIKEIAIVGPGGQTLCTDLGLPPSQRKTIWSEPLAGAGWYALALIQLENGQPMLRFSREVGGGPNGLAAVVPAMQFLPQVSTQGGPFSAFAQIATESGALIGNVGERADATNGTFVAAKKSDKFGFCNLGIRCHANV